MMTITAILDALALASAMLAAWLWFRASSYRVRRVSKAEELNHLDLNRIVTSINRAQVLNRRAALATGVSALAIACKFAHDLLMKA
jgi:uncharacterized SAM-binding protein YcdF (DUF218 family)